VTIPTDGWAFQCDISQAAQYDTAVDVTLAAGDYFISGDGQTDDLLFQFATQVMADGNWPGADAYFAASIDPGTNKVKIMFAGEEFEGATKQQVRIDWPNSSDLAAALGFDSSAVDTEADDHPVFTGDWDVGYNWWANEDSLLLDLPVEDISAAETLQSIAVDGTLKTQKLAERFMSEMSLQFLERERAFSRGVGYGTAPVYPYERNRGLECWWQEAQQGIEFRVYRDAYRDTARANDTGSYTVTDATTMTDGNKGWDTEPPQWDNALLHFAAWGYSITDGNIPMSFFVSSHTATVITVANAHPSGLDVARGAQPYYLYHHRYQTYVLDIARMSEFRPEEIGALDRYNITIPLRRYVA
jgi:hypothetical protein